MILVSEHQDYDLNFDFQDHLFEVILIFTITKVR